MRLLKKLQYNFKNDREYRITYIVQKGEKNSQFCGQYQQFKAKYDNNIWTLFECIVYIVPDMTVFIFTIRAFLEMSNSMVLLLEPIFSIRKWIVSFKNDFDLFLFLYLCIDCCCSCRSIHMIQFVCTVYFTVIDKAQAKPIDYNSFIGVTKQGVFIVHNIANLYVLSSSHSKLEFSQNMH